MTDTTPVPPVPSREAVEEMSEALVLDDYIFAASMLRTLYAEVERLTTEIEAYERLRDEAILEIRTAICNAIMTKVEEQDGALAELVRVWRCSTVSADECADALEAVLASAKS